MDKKLAVLLLILSITMTACNPPSQKEARPEYQAAFQQVCDVFDARYQAKIPVLKLEMTKEEYEKRKEETRKKLPDASTEGELYCILQEFAAGFQDAHTVVRADFEQKPEEFYFLPYAFTVCEGDFYVTQSPVSDADYLGWQLCGINDDSVEEIRENMADFLSCENEYSLEINMEYALSSVDVLKYLDIIEEGKEEAVLTLKNVETKEKEKLTCQIVNYQQKEETEYVDLVRDKSPETGKEGIYRSFLLKEGVYFIQINQHIKDESYSINRFTDQVSADLKQYQPSKILIDLRYNSGGYTDLFNHFMRVLKEWTDGEETDVYTLISNRTASAAVMMAADCRDKLHSTLIGEPTSQRPNFNGHVGREELKNTSLSLEYGTLYIRTIDGGDDLTMLEPDILVPQTMEDWKNGADPVVDEILAME